MSAETVTGNHTQVLVGLEGQDSEPSGGGKSLIVLSGREETAMAHSCRFLLTLCPVLGEKKVNGQKNLDYINITT